MSSSLFSHLFMTKKSPYSLSSILYLYVSLGCMDLHILICIIGKTHFYKLVNLYNVVLHLPEIHQQIIKLSSVPAVMQFHGVSKMFIGICSSDSFWVHLIGLVSMWLTYVALYLPSVIDELVLVGLPTMADVTQASADKWLTSTRDQKHFAIRWHTERDIDCEGSVCSHSHCCLMA